MGIRFSEPADESIGAAIDRLVSGFAGLRIVVVAASPLVRSHLVRIVRSVLSSADVVEAGNSDVAEAVMHDDADLAFIDVEDTGPDGLLAVQVARSHPRPIPVIVAVRREPDRRRARSLGADEVVESPPSLGEFQAAALRAIGKPTRVTR